MKNKNTVSKIGLLTGKKKPYDEIAFLIECIQHQISQIQKRESYFFFLDLNLFYTKAMETPERSKLSFGH